MVMTRELQAKAVTTYNQVADELVSEFRKEDRASCDEKNIRRRAYDALNVLTAMDIISKDKKHIRWKGLVNVVGDAERKPDLGGQLAERERLLSLLRSKKEEICDKEQRLGDLSSHFVALRLLLRRNCRPDVSSQNDGSALRKIYLPFILGNFFFHIFINFI